jgi:hypothetical protein
VARRGATWLRLESQLKQKEQNQHRKRKKILKSASLKIVN